MIFAWGGATHARVQPLVSFYRSRGLEVHLQISDVMELSFNQDAWRRKIGWLVSEVHALASAEPLIFHVFSNTGFLSFFEFVSQSRRLGQDPLARSALQIFECGPGIPYPLGAEEFVDLWTRSTIPILRLGRGDPAKSRSVLAVAGIRGVWHLYYRVYRSWVQEMQRASAWLTSEPLKTPYRFLYSSSDEVIPPEYIERCMDRLRSAGADLEARRWDGVSHVSMSRRATDSYFAYLGDCLAGIAESDAP